jgi:nucleolysin TIA-1/TIAR
MDQGGMENWEPDDSPDPTATILFIENLDCRISDQILLQVFQAAPAIGMKAQKVQMNMSKDHGQTCDCYVYFEDNASCAQGHGFIHNRTFHERKVKASWACPGPGGIPRILSGSVSVYVGDLEEGVTDQELKEFFENKLFKECLSAKIVIDPNTGVSKGFGFAVFNNKADAQAAIKLHGQIYKNRKIKVNWASRNKPQVNQKTLQEKEVSEAASPENCTVYVGGIPAGTNAGQARTHFELEGTEIVDFRIFIEKGYAFIKYDSHDSATRVIVEKNGTQLGHSQLKCWWGKDGPQPGPGDGGVRIQRSHNNDGGGNFQKQNNFSQNNFQQHQQFNPMQQMSNQVPPREVMREQMAAMFQCNGLVGDKQEEMLDHMQKDPGYFHECMRKWNEYLVAQQQQVMMHQMMASNPAMYQQMQAQQQQQYQQYYQQQQAAGQQQQQGNMNGQQHFNPQQQQMQHGQMYAGQPPPQH